MGKQGVVEKWVIGDGYRMRLEMEILVSQKDCMDQMTLSQDYRFMLCRGSSHFMICFEDHVFTPNAL